MDFQNGKEYLDFLVCVLIGCQSIIGITAKTSANEYVKNAIKYKYIKVPISYLVLTVGTTNLNLNEQHMLYLYYSLALLIIIYAIYKDVEDFNEIGPKAAKRRLKKKR